MNFVVEVGIFGIKSVELCLSCLKKFDGNLFKQSVCQDVLVLNCPRLHSLAETFKLRLEQVCGTAGYGSFIADYLLSEFGRNFNGSFAVFAADKSLEFLCDHLIAFAADNVEHRLRADNLRAGRDKRRLTFVSSDVRNFCENVGEEFALSRLFELGDEI